MREYFDMQGAEKIVIYGAHLVARQMLAYFKFHGIEDKMLGFAVTKKAGNPDRIDGFQVKVIDDYECFRESVLVIIATPEKFLDEIEAGLKRYGFIHIARLGNQGLARFQNGDIIEYFNKFFPRLNARQDEDEFFCVDVFPYGYKMKFMPLASYPIDKAGTEYLKKIDEDERLLKCLKSIYDTDAYEGCQGEQGTLMVYVVSSPKDLGSIKERDKKSWEIPVVAGVELLDNIPADAVGDNIGQNISVKNRAYAEATVTYWAWKNSTADYKGISHYRRRYLLTDSDVEDISAGLWDVVLTVPRLVLPSLRQWFVEVSSLSLDDLKVLEELVGEMNQEDVTIFKEYLDGHVLFPNNMVIARSDVYDEYCEWLFSVLEELDKDDRGIEFRGKQRYAAYSAEILTSFFFVKRLSKYRIKVVDYELLK